MKAVLLLEHYERIAEAPDAIARLRRFVLDLAVRGKLVEQDPNDEPTSKLVSTFQAERKIRIANREMRNPKQLRGIDDPPFEIPAGWLWLPLGETGNIFSGNSINESTRERLSQTQSGRPFIATKDVGYGLDELAYANGLLVPEGDANFKVARPDTPLICSEGGSAGRKIGLCDREICFGNKLIANEPWSKISPRYVLYVYLSPFFFEEFRSRMTGVIGGISLNRFVELPFPLPPFQEQQRIVAKVDELMALCDQLEAAREEREGQRDKLTLSALAKLNEPDPETFPDDAHFALEHLEPLTKRTDQIKQLRQTILRLALSGKLTDQDQADKPALELLATIEERRSAMLNSGYPNPSEARTQQRKVAEQSLPSTLPELPQGWHYATLQQCALMVIDCKNKTAPYTQNGVRLIRTTNVRDGKLNAIDQRYVSPETYEVWSARAKPEPGDILITREAPMGEVCLIPEDTTICLGQRMMLARLVPGTIDPRFMLYSLMDPDLMDRVQDKPIGMTVQHLRVGGVETLIVPLPPLAEQHRIVAKVDALMALCDQLEGRLTEGEQTRSKLLDAVLHEAFEAA